MSALVEAWRAGLLGWRHWPRNLLAGTIVGVVALPLAMAFAIASGARPEQGIYTAIVAGLVVSLFGGSRLQIAGPTGAFVAILAGITAEFGIAGLQIATMLAGLMLIAMGLARLGAVIRFIPTPVIVGFTAGIGVVIFVGQWADFLGLPRAPASSGGLPFHAKLMALLCALPSSHLPTILVGASTLGLLLVTPRLPGVRRVPAPLLAMVLATLATTLLGRDDIATIGSAFAGIPLTALAAILFVVAWNMSDAPHVAHILRRAPLADRLILLVTLLLTVFVDLVVAVNVGVVLAMLQFVRRMVETTDVAAVDSDTLAQALPSAAVPSGIAVTELTGPMFFGAIANIESTLLRSLELPHAIVLRLHRVPFVDFTGIDALQRTATDLERRGIRVVLCEANARVLGKLRAAQLELAEPTRGYCDSLGDALKALTPVGTESVNTAQNAASKAT